jgi:hypothetical protein
MRMPQRNNGGVAVSATAATTPAACVRVRVHAGARSALPANLHHASTSFLYQTDLPRVCRLACCCLELPAREEHTRPAHIRGLRQHTSCRQAHRCSNKAKAKRLAEARARTVVPKWMLNGSFCTIGCARCSVSPSLTAFPGPLDANPVLTRLLTKGHGIAARDLSANDAEQLDLTPLHQAKVQMSCHLSLGQSLC